MTRRHLEREYETATYDQLRALQWERLIQQVHRAASTRFYRRRPPFRDDAGWCCASWRQFAEEVPVTRKPDLLEDIACFPPYGSRLACSRSEIVGIAETSGTSGGGKEIHVLAAPDRDRISIVEAYGFAWAGIQAGSVVMLTLPIGTGAAGAWWLLGLERLGALTIRAGLLSTAEKLDYIRRFDVEVILGTPSYLTRLEAAAADFGQVPAADLPSVRTLIVAGEARSATWARERAERWDAQIFEQWGCTAGGVAWSCESGTGSGMLHCTAPWTLLEVIDPNTGQHVKNGAFGEIVITQLGVVGAPLLRFATGDRARFLSWEHCGCERPFDGIEAGSVARYDDMVKIKGVNVWPMSVSNLVEQYADIEDYAVRIFADSRGREIAELSLFPSAGADLDSKDRLLDQLGRQLKATTGVTFTLRVASVVERQRAIVVSETSGKAARWDDQRRA